MSKHDKEKTIQELNEKIKFWEEKMKRTINSADAGILHEKIVNAKKEITKLNSKEIDHKIVRQIDTPSLADKDTDIKNIERGQIIDNSEY